MAGVDNAGPFIGSDDLVLFGERPPNFVAAGEERHVLNDVALLLQINRVPGTRVGVRR